jgi:hypothetical protein
LKSKAGDDGRNAELGVMFIAILKSLDKIDVMENVLIENKL